MVGVFLISSVFSPHWRYRHSPLAISAGSAENPLLFMLALIGLCLRASIAVYSFFFFFSRDFTPEIINLNFIFVLDLGSNKRGKNPKLID